MLIRRTERRHRRLPHVHRNALAALGLPQRFRPQLPEPERTIITYQFGLGVPRMSLRALSPRLGFTIRQITRCRQRALAMLHTWLTEDIG